MCFDEGVGTLKTRENTKEDWIKAFLTNGYLR